MPPIVKDPVAFSLIEGMYVTETLQLFRGAKGAVQVLLWVNPLELEMPVMLVVYAVVFVMFTTRPSGSVPTNWVPKLTDGVEASIAELLPKPLRNTVSLV